jgi:hypothetical protein
MSQVGLYKVGSGDHLRTCMQQPKSLQNREKNIISPKTNNFSCITHPNAKSPAESALSSGTSSKACFTNTRTEFGYSVDILYS